MLGLLDQVYTRRIYQSHSKSPFSSVRDVKPAEFVPIVHWADLSDEFYESGQLSDFFLKLVGDSLQSNCYQCLNHLFTGVGLSVNAFSRSIDFDFPFEPIRITLLIGWLLSLFWYKILSFYLEPLQIFSVLQHTVG